MAMPGTLALAVTVLVGAMVAFGCRGGSGARTATPTPSATRALTPIATTAATQSGPGIRSVSLTAVPDVQKALAGTGGQLVQSDVIYADLTGDGIDEAVVPISSGGTMGDIGFVVLTPSGEGTKTVFASTLPGKPVAVSVEGGKLIAVEPIFGPSDPNCCPSSLRRTVYGWSGSLFAVESQTTGPSPSGGGKATPTS